MADKEIFVIDGADFDSLEGFFCEISRMLIPEVSWGPNLNLDAFNDILRGGFGTPDEGFILCWRNSDISRQRLGYEETVRQLEKRLTRCHPSNVPHIQDELEQAKRHQGPTVFDWLVEIIRTHGEGGEEAEDGVELRLE